ncbi:MAG: NUDIX domain-containing protein [Alphaproteobacteria bacterium]|nr:NUDIX domain-containing protein [Alphaproteobacteria bacterium]
MLFRRYTSLLVSTSLFVQTVSPAFAMDEDSDHNTEKRPSKHLILKIEKEISQPSIIMVKNLSEMDKTAGVVVQPGDWVVSDIDKTILNQGSGANEEILNLDPKFVEMVKSWQELNAQESNPSKHITILFLTARKLKNEEKTREQLKRLGFSENIEIIFAPNDKSFGGKIPTKGKALINRLEGATKSMPRRLIMIDDLKENLINIYDTFQNDITYKNIPLKLLCRETRTKMYESPDSDICFPKTLTDLTYIRHLSGGSGGVHVLKDNNGKLFTFKGAGHPDQMKEEILADALYRSLGVKVPAFAVYDHLPNIMEVQTTCTGPGPYRLASFIEENQTKSSDVCILEMRKHFIADALLSNFDIVVGGFKNVVLDKTGSLWRVDNGGSLRFRALGESKFTLPDWDAHEVTELNTMRNASDNREGALVYGSLTDEELREQIKQVLAKSDKLLMALDTVCESLHIQNPSEVREMLRRRLDDLVKKYLLTPPSPDLTYFDGFFAPKFGAGICVHSVDPITGKKVILLGKRRGHNWWCIFGGQADLHKGLESDLSCAHTAVREVQEESLGNISFTPQELEKTPSHAVLNSDNVFYRMFTAPHHFVAPEQIEKTQPIKDYGWEAEYSEYRWVPLDQFLLGLEQNHLVEEESRKTIQIGDMILYPYFWEMLQEKQVLDTLTNICTGQKIRAKHTHDAKAHHISIPLSVEAEKQKRAETNVNKGFVLGNIVSKTPQQDVEHSADVQAMSGFLRDQEAQDIRDALLKAPYTQTQAYLRKTLGRETFESLQGNPDQEIDEFLDNHSQFSDIKNTKDQHYRNVLKQVYKTEKLYKDKAMFAHATDPLTCFLWDILTAHRSQLKHRGAHPLITTRGLEDRFVSILDVDAFIAKYTKSSGSVSNYDTVEDIHYADMGLSVNPFLFGNDGNSTSSTYYLFHNTSSISPIKQEQLFNAFMTITGIPGNFKDYKALFQQYYLFNDKYNSKLFQFFIDPQVVDTVAYMAVSGGDVLAVEMDDKTSYHGFAKILSELRMTPDKFDDRLQNRVSGKLSWGRDTNNLQGRLFLNPKIFLEQQYVSCLTYWRYPVSEEMEASYTQKLNAQASQDLTDWLTQHSPLQKNTFVEGIPVLKKLYSYAYEGTMQLCYRERELKSMLPIAIKSGNIEMLKGIFTKYPEIDINEDIENINYRGYGSAKILPVNLLNINAPHFPEIIKLFVEKGLKTVPSWTGQNLQNKIFNELILYTNTLPGELLDCFNQFYSIAKSWPWPQLLNLQKQECVNLFLSILGKAEELTVGYPCPEELSVLMDILKSNKTIKSLTMDRRTRLTFMNLLTSEEDKTYKQAPWFQNALEKMIADANQYLAMGEKDLLSFMTIILSETEETYRQEPWFQKAWDGMIANSNLYLKSAFDNKNYLIISSIIKNPTVDEINLSNFNFETDKKGLDILVEGLLSKPSIKTLKMSKIDGKGEWLAELLKTPHISTLDFGNSYLWGDQLPYLADALKGSRTLEKLILSDLDMLNLMDILCVSKDGAFTQAPWYKDTWNNYIENPETPLKAAIKSKKHRLMCAILGDSPQEVALGQWTTDVYDDEWISPLTKMLENNEPFKSGRLNLSNMSLYRDEYMKSLTHALGKNKTLVSLNLMDCSLSSSGIQALAEGLIANITLERVILSKATLFEFVNLLTLDTEAAFKDAPWFQAAWQEYLSFPSIEIFQAAVKNKAWTHVIHVIKNVDSQLDLTVLNFGWGFDDKNWNQALIEGLKSNPTLKEVKINAYQLLDVVGRLMSSPEGPFTHAPWFTHAQDEVFKNPKEYIDNAICFENFAAILSLLKKAPGEIPLGKFINTYSGGDLLKALAEDLAKNDDYRQLNLSGIFIGGNMPKLAEAFSNTTKLKSLTLIDSRVRGDEAKALAEGLKDNKTLENLLLSKEDMVDVMKHLMQYSEDSAFRQAPWFVHTWHKIIDHPEENINIAFQQEQHSQEKGQNKKFIVKVLSDTKVEYLNLTNLFIQFYSDETIWNIVTEGLRNNKTLLRLKACLYDFKRAADMKTLLGLFQNNKTLTCLELEGNGVLESSTVDLLAEELKTNGSLQELTFGQEATLQVLDTLYPNLDKLPEMMRTWVNTKMKDLMLNPLSHLKCCLTSSYEQKALPNLVTVILESLTELKLDNVVPMHRHVLFESLKSNRSISVLDLEFPNYYYSSPFPELTNFLRETRTLKSFTLRSPLSSSEAHVLAEAFSENDTLQTLDLSGSSLLPEGIPALAGALRKNKFSKTLNLPAASQIALLNELISDKEDVPSSYWKKQMQPLWDRLCEDAHASLVTAIQSAHKNIAFALLKMEKITELNMEHTYLGDKSKDVLREILKKDKFLQSVKTSDYNHEILTTLLPLKEQLSQGVKAWIEASWNAIMENPQKNIDENLSKHGSNIKIAEMILNIGVVKILNITDNYGDGKFQRLFSILKNNNTLEQLYLSGNLDNLDFRDLCNNENLTLKTLDLSACTTEYKFRQSCLKPLIDLLHSKQQLTVIFSKDMLEGESSTHKNFLELSTFIESGRLVIK